MAGFRESGVELDFPNGKWFRFYDLPSYRKLSGYNFKEVDACWQPESRELFYLIELKDYSTGNALTKKNVESRIDEIVKKSVNSLQMTLSMIFQTQYGRSLEKESGIDLHSQNQRLRLIVVVCENPENILMLNSQKDVCQRRFLPYVRLWGGIEYHILTYSQAKKYFGTFVK